MKVLIVLLFFVSLNLFAHGENKYGPHHGHIRMPGTFHTELVQNKNGSFNVFLLEMNNQKPLTENSKVDLTYSNKEIQIKFNCTPNYKEFNFVCKSSHKINLKSGKIIIQAIRNAILGNDAVYELPLKLTQK